MGGPGLHIKIRVLVAAGCFAIVLLYVWQTISSWMLVDRSMARQTANLAASLAQQTSSSFETTDAVLQRMYFWANLRGIAPPQRALLQDLLRVRTPSMKSIRALVFFDAAGNAVVRSGPLPSAETAETERRAVRYHAGHTSLEPLVLTPGTPQDPDGEITVSRRFDDRHGLFAGVVLATIALPSLRPLYDAVDIGRDGVISLILNDGTIVLRRPLGNAASWRDNRSPEFARRARTASSGSYYLRSPIDGLERMIAFHRVEGMPLFVAVGLGLSETFEGWRIASIVGFVVRAGSSLRSFF